VTWALLALVGCADPDPAPEPVDSSLPITTWATWVEPFFLTYCTSCHAADAAYRYGAPPSVTFDTPEQVLDRADRIIAALGPEGGRMPPGGGVPVEDIDRLAAWLAAGGDPR
jgi:uncharacterized membrane protein